MKKKQYISPSVKSKKIKLNYFYRADHWFDDIDHFFINETYAQSGFTVYLPIIINEGGGGGGGGGGGSGS